MPAHTIDQAFAIALQHHQAGRLADAEAIYRQILAVHPNHAPTLHLSGVLMMRHGQFERAFACIQRAIAIDPRNAAAHSNLGEVYRCLGRLDDAVGAYRRAIAIDPNLPDAHNNLANVLRGLGKFDEALATCRRALVLKPDFAEACNNLGNTLADLRSLDEAVAAFRHALELRPHFVDAQTNLASVLLELGRLDEAIAAFRHALALDPDNAIAHHHLGIALRRQGDLHGSIAAYRRALALNPGNLELPNDLGAALAETGQSTDAEACFRRTLELHPASARTWNNLGHVLNDLGRFDEADAAFRRALEIDPHQADARFGLALLRLLHGDFAEGWPLYEGRWDAYRSQKREFSQPMWDGRIVEGQRLLIHAEQGFGDSIQFIRYAALAAARGAEVIVECPLSLLELFRGVKGVGALVRKGDPLPPFDVHLPMLSQPLVFHTRHETIPHEIPYLFADPAKRDGWAERLGARRPRPRIGLAWAGNARHRRARIRDLPFEILSRLLQVNDIDFFSLQVSPNADQLHQPANPPGIIDFSSHLENFADTAALIAELDLIISVDTAVAHLAGALGRPVWTLLPYAPDWRWGLEGDSTPWYPTMRLFRQPSPGDWPSLIPLLAHELDRFRTDIPLSALSDRR